MGYLVVLSVLLLLVAVSLVVGMLVVAPEHQASIAVVALWKERVSPLLHWG